MELVRVIVRYFSFSFNYYYNTFIEGGMKGKNEEKTTAAHKAAAASYSSLEELITSVCEDIAQNCFVSIFPFFPRTTQHACKHY